MILEHVDISITVTLKQPSERQSNIELCKYSSNCSAGMQHRICAAKRNLHDSYSQMHLEGAEGEEVFLLSCNDKGRKSAFWPLVASFRYKFAKFIIRNFESINLSCH